MKVREKEKEMEARSIKGEKTHSVDNVCFVKTFFFITFNIDYIMLSQTLYFTGY